MNLFQHIDNDFNYVLNMAGDDVTINNNTTPIKALINNLPVNRHADIRTIASLSQLARGDYITWDSEKWLIISEIGHKRFSYYKGIIQKCNNNVKFNIKGIIRTIPCIVDSRYFDIETGQFMPTPTGKVIVTMPYNTEIGLNQRFIKMGNAFKIVGKDLTKNGLSIYTCELDQFAPEDDIENEIADAESYIYSLSITNGDTAGLYIDETLQLNVELKLNNEVVTGIDIAYYVDKSSIASISNDGLITGLSEGNCIVTAYMVDMPNIKDTIEITVEEVVQDNFTYEIIGSADISKNSTQNYIANKYNNCVLVENAQFDFTIIPGSTPTSAYTLTIVSDTECSITAKANTYYITLRATDRADNTQYAEKEIRLKAMF